MAMVMNKAAPIEASKGNQPRFSLGNSIGMNASAPAGAKYSCPLEDEEQDSRNG